MVDVIPARVTLNTTHDTSDQLVLVDPRIVDGRLAGDATVALDRWTEQLALLGTQR